MDYTYDSARLEEKLEESFSLLGKAYRSRSPEDIAAAQRQFNERGEGFGFYLAGSILSKFGGTGDRSELGELDKPYFYYLIGKELSNLPSQWSRDGNFGRGTDEILMQMYQDKLVKPFMISSRVEHLKDSGEYGVLMGNVCEILGKQFPVEEPEDEPVAIESGARLFFGRFSIVRFFG